MRAEQGGDLVRRSEHREHRAFAPFVVATRHDRAAPLCQHRQRSIVDPAGCAQRGQLAETMPAGQVGANPKLFQNTQQSQADRSNRRLGDPSVA